MRFSVSYDSLVGSLVYANTILSDKTVDEKVKNIIFMVENNRVRVVGYNDFVFSRTDLECSKSELDESDSSDGLELFQVKASSLNKILSSFSSLYKTKVSKVEVAYEGVRVKISIHEDAVNEEDSRLSQISEFMVENVPILPNIRKNIVQEFPDVNDMIVSKDLYFYLDLLLPIMSNDSSGTNASKLNFSDDYIFVFTSIMSGFVKNRLPDSFKGLTLSYSSVNFLKKLSEDAENLMVSKLDKYLCVQGNSTESFIRYHDVRIKYKPYLERLNKDKGILIDRLYLKDVLKRMGNLSPDGKMTIEEDCLEVANGNFKQVIPLNKVKPGTAGISFNVSIKRLTDAIIGRDDVFSSDLFIYFVPQARSYSIYIQDKTGAWLANTQVTSA